MHILILENHYFEFEDKIYHQKLRVAIGTKFAPSFASIFMSKLEEKMLRGYHLNPLVLMILGRYFPHLAPWEGKFVRIFRLC